MRLIQRDDTTLVAALIVGAVLVFHQPLRGALDAIHDVEVRYHLDLVPALTLLSVALMFHQYRRREQAKAETRAMAAEAALVRARNEDLQRLMTFGQELTATLDRGALQQALWRGLATFAGSREYWVLTRDGGRWDPLVQDVQRARRRGPDVLESVASRAATRDSADPHEVGVVVDGHLCFGIVNAGELSGVLGFADPESFNTQERTAISTVASLIGIALSNIRLLEEARDAGIRDKLTGCFRRNYGLDTLQNELRRARRSGRPLSVIMFDIDHFKQINDEGGHLRGDQVLAKVGASVKSILRGSDVTCRYGGDEFLVILPDTPILGAQQVAECIRREAPDEVTISLGVAVSQPGEMNPTAVIARADEALYRAKAAGRNRFCTAGVPNVVDFSAAAHRTAREAGA